MRSFFHRATAFLLLALLLSPAAAQAPASVASLDSIRDAFALGPKDAPITILNFSDFACPFSARISTVLDQVMRAYPGKVRVIFKHSPLNIHPEAPLAHEGALAAAAQGKFWQMQVLLFTNQKRQARADLIEYARSLSLDVDRFTADLDSHRYRPLLDQDLADSHGLGINATPTLYVNGKQLVGSVTAESFKQLISRQLGESASTLPPSQPVATSRVYGLDASSSVPARGAQSAPVTIVEFSDFECPFCRRAVDTLKQVIALRPGKVKWVFKHYPLDSHKNSMLAHEATLAAAEQGKFWEMHDELFANQKQLQRADILGIAKQLRLDEKRFTADLDSGRYKGIIAADRAQGAQFDVGGTPTMFVNGKRVNGARSLAEMLQVVDQELKAGPETASSVSRVVKGSAKESNHLIAGPAAAPVTLVWFADVRSSLASATSSLLQTLVREYKGKVNLVYKNAPLPTRKDPRLAQEVLMAAAAQGKFWEAHQALLDYGPRFDKSRLDDLAARISVQPVVLTSSAANEAVAADIAEAIRRQVRGTPVIFVNGKRVDGLQSERFYRELIDSELKK